MPRFGPDLRQTVLIVAAMVAIVAVGWAMSAMVGRERIVLYPGVSILRPHGEAIPYGQLWQYRWRIGEADLYVIPAAAAADVATILDVYRLEHLVQPHPDIRFEPPGLREHPAGDAMGQDWELSTEPDGVRGRLTVVMRRSTSVVFDARWPASADPPALREIEHVVDSLRIDPVVP